ncbi:hypothetical protein JW935_17335 [candidate division KSB1 bacterium]|nr:hypothetical protein [candidate division KSB1 bacterium]
MLKRINFFLLTQVVLYAGILARNIDLKFSHKQHTEDVGAECTDCHVEAQASTSPHDNLLPLTETCNNCHDKNAECTMCHKDPDNVIGYPQIPPYISKFNHSKHTGGELTCLSCHTGMNVSGDGNGTHLPGMEMCITCHKNKEKPNDCTFCHDPGEDLKPQDHRMAWQLNHGPASHVSPESCEMCHSQYDCLECHNGDNLDHKVHPLNFNNNHSIQAKGNQENCYACHQDLNYCHDCHRAELVMPRNHSAAGWSNRQNGGIHARAARMDLDSCASCHNDAGGEPVCAECHQSQKI